MKQKISMKLLLACTVASLATASAVYAQGPIVNPQTATPNEPVYGELGSNYAETDFGYLHHTSGTSSIGHEYDLDLNQNVYQEGITGLDAQLGYSYLDLNGNGYPGHRQGVDLNGVGYLTQSWGKPFVEAGIGLDNQRIAGISSHSYTYDVGGGVEFQLLRNLVVIPEVTYDGTPKLTTPSYADRLPNFEWNYGAKVAYRFDRHWDVSVGAFADRDRDMTYRAGVGFHY